MIKCLKNIYLFRLTPSINSFNYYASLLSSLNSMLIVLLFQPRCSDVSHWPRRDRNYGMPNSGFNKGKITEKFISSKFHLLSITFSAHLGGNIERSRFTCVSAVCSTSAKPANGRIFSILTGHTQGHYKHKHCRNITDNIGYQVCH